MSARRSSHEDGRTKFAPPSPSNDRRPRPSIKTRNLGMGCIVWLPPKRDDDDRDIRCTREPCCDHRELQKEGYDHPVVVLKVSKNYLGEAVCSIAMASLCLLIFSRRHFSNMNQVTSKERTNRLDRIRISQEGPAPCTCGGNGSATELYLEKDTMDKQSYVKLEHIFQAPASQLRLCSSRHGSRAYDSRLCEKSYTLLVARFGLEPELWVSTTVLEHSLANSRAPLRRQNWEQSRPSRPAAIANNPVSSSPYRYTEVSPLLSNNTSPRMPGAWHQYGGYQTPVQQPLNRDYQYPRIEQRGYVSHPADDDGDSKFLFKSLAMLLTVGAFVWWVYRANR